MKKSLARRTAHLTDEQRNQRQQSIAEKKQYYQRLLAARAELPPNATPFDIRVVDRLVAEAKAEWREARLNRQQPLLSMINTEQKGNA